MAELSGGAQWRTYGGGSACDDAEVSTLLHVSALVAAVLLVPSVAGITARGLAGGDGSPKNPLLGLLAVLGGFGSVYVTVTCWTAFWGLPDWRWWLMLVPPAAGLAGLVASAGDTEESPQDWMIGLTLQLLLAVPALLLLAAGVATP